MQTNLTSTIVLYNTESILYPWREAINSVLPVSDRVVINCCHNNEFEFNAFNDYLASIRDVDREKIVVIRGEWGDKAETISELTNQCLEYVNTDWYFNIQGDEILDDRSYKEMLWLTTKQKSFTASRVNYHHLVGDFNTEFKFVYERVVRIARKGLAWRSLLDGMEIGGGGGTPYNGSIQIWHLGKVDIGRKREALAKEMSFWPMFVHINPDFPDPLIVEASKVGYLEYKKIFKSAEERGEFSTLTTRFPVAMQPYVDRMTAKEWQDNIK